MKTVARFGLCVGTFAFGYFTVTFFIGNEWGDFGMALVSAALVLSSYFVEKNVE